MKNIITFFLEKSICRLVEFSLKYVIFFAKLWRENQLPPLQRALHLLHSDDLALFKDFDRPRRLRRLVRRDPHPPKASRS